MSYYLTVKIAPPGTQTGASTSMVGRTRYELTDSVGHADGYGFIQA